jgi:Regulator of chromosome condensation (RCC1) repeat
MREKPSHIKNNSNMVAIALAVIFFIISSQTLASAVQPIVAAGDNHTVGLKSNGTVVAVGLNNDGQLNVNYWTNIVQVDAGNAHTVGVKADGTSRVPQAFSLYSKRPLQCFGY